MLPILIRMNILTVLLFAIVSFAYGQDRKISSYINPGCSYCPPDKTLVYTKAIGSDNTIHQIWDFTGGLPTIIFVIGTVNSSLHITWDGTNPEKFLMSDEPQYSFAAAIDKLYEYDDVEDVGHIDPSVPQKAYSLRHMYWARNASKMTETEAMVAVRGHFQDRAGLLEMKLDLLPFNDYAVQLPHLIHTANSTLVDVSVVNVTSSRAYNASRFALHLLLVSTDPAGDTMRYSMRRSLDDEHTPGVFEIVEIKTPESSRNSDGGFIQFRPVAYTQQERSVASSTNARISNFNKTLIPARSTLDKFYSYKYDPHDLLVQDIFISFGETGDGYYKQHNYTAWSFTIGYGEPPIESFSLFVIVIISIGLGVPVLLALSGVTYVVVKKYRARNAPTRFTDDD
uniref:Lysosomal protein NCU-G1 n=1 Tax=Pectinophora gossypiella TaxID=13191 RepID=A0A1E1WLR1_PECGO